MLPGRRGMGFRIGHVIAPRRKSRSRRGLHHFRPAFCTTQGAHAGLRSASWAERGNFGRWVVEAEDSWVELGLWHQGGDSDPRPGWAVVSAPTGVAGREDEGRFCKASVPATAP